MLRRQRPWTPLFSFFSFFSFFFFSPSLYLFYSLFVFRLTLGVFFFFSFLFSTFISPCTEAKLPLGSRSVFTTKTRAIQQPLGEDFVRAKYISLSSFILSSVRAFFGCIIFLSLLFFLHINRMSSSLFLRILNEKTCSTWPSVFHGTWFLVDSTSTYCHLSIFNPRD
ncbi:uncharacterized protein CIMG_12869 [Coccidioides immitis RS]|uniref:Transmembrane protein n=1 Tax=Coccidioides immitis (strain RS) TaxID=246410 RepID=A0A0D8JTL3_COCIM|nr:uncharacterized protein CIMG_12869 [Coccidioides immitis RS]KJF60306.1 hypothetical protein CIMG_12869 [Coccidioides immitis RS]